MNCEELVHYLSDYIDHCLSDELAEAARIHLACCPNCRVVLDSTQQLILLYQKAGGPAIPISRRAALYNRLERALNDALNCQ
jgi:hypothetical protein